MKGCSVAGTGYPSRMFLYALRNTVQTFLLLCSTAALCSESVITIASYNPENIWDSSPDNTNSAWLAFLSELDEESRRALPESIQYNDYSQGYSNWYQQRIMETKSRNFLEVLRLSGYPDIVALQELECAGNQANPFSIPLSVHNSLQEGLHRLGYHHILVGSQENRNPVSVTTAIISKIPLIPAPSVRINFGTYSPSDRDIQVVELNLGNQRILLFNGHFKSKGGGAASEEIRRRTARALRLRIQEERLINPDSDIIVLGDLNSYYYEAPLRDLGGTGYERLMTSQTTDLLYNLWYEKPVLQRWEHSYDGELNTLSHILLSDTLYDHQGLQYIDGSFEVTGHDEPASSKLLGADGSPWRWQIERTSTSAIHKGSGYSDHLPLLASFRIMPWSPDPEYRRRKMRLTDPGREAGEAENPPVILTQTRPCPPAKTYPDLLELTASEILRLQGHCVTINGARKLRQSLPFEVRGLRESVWIKLPGKGNPGIGVKMMRPWDWRPNIDDSRVSYHEALIRPGRWNPSHPHPRSNRCFQQAVLQGAGGALSRATGRLGITDGTLNIHISSRESSHLVLTQLPEEKLRACPWDTQMDQFLPAALNQTKIIL